MQVHSMTFMICFLLQLPSPTRPLAHVQRFGILDLTEILVHAQTNQSPNTLPPSISLFSQCCPTSPDVSDQIVFTPYFPLFSFVSCLLLLSPFLSPSSLHSSLLLLSVLLLAVCLDFALLLFWLPCCEQFPPPFSKLPPPPHPLLSPPPLLYLSNRPPPPPPP